MNIKTHEFCDYAMYEVKSANNIAVTIDVKRSPWIALYRDDAIALCKHFKLTADDIKE